MTTTAPPDIPGLVAVQPLGSGGFAEVFLYEQQMPRMNVAVKVLRSDGLTDSLRRQFTEEANTMAQLGDHPYIVQIFRTDTAADGRPYLVMKYYPPPNLAARSRQARFGVEEVLRTGIQLASAVETAHRAGIVHRDIKPANVLVSQYGAPGLTDFGIAGRHGRPDEDETGVSVPWAAPEVLFGHTAGDVRSDIYSLAATLWQLLVGRSPFEVPGGDNTAFELMPRIRSAAVPSTGRADVPASLDRLLAHAMAKDPGVRPASALEFARALQGVEQEQRFSRTEIVVLDEQGQTTLADAAARGGRAAGAAPTGDTTRVAPVRVLSGATVIPPAPPVSAPGVAWRAPAPAAFRAPGQVSSPSALAAMPTSMPQPAPTTSRSTSAPAPAPGAHGIPDPSSRDAHHPDHPDHPDHLDHPDHPDHPAADDDRPRREISPGVLLGFVGIVIVSIAAVAIWAISSHNASPDPQPSPSVVAQPSDDAPLADLPTPVIRARGATGSVAFQWTYAGRGASDSYRVKVAGSAAALRTATFRRVTDTALSVPATAGTTRCAQVQLVRGGVPSPYSAPACERAG